MRYPHAVGASARAWCVSAVHAVSARGWRIRARAVRLRDTRVPARTQLRVTRLVPHTKQVWIATAPRGRTARSSRQERMQHPRASGASARKRRIRAQATHPRARGASARARCIRARAALVDAPLGPGPGPSGLRIPRSRHAAHASTPAPSPARSTPGQHDCNHDRRPPRQPSSSHRPRVQRTRMMGHNRPVPRVHRQNSEDDSDSKLLDKVSGRLQFRSLVNSWYDSNCENGNYRGFLQGEKTFS